MNLEVENSSSGRRNSISSDTLISIGIVSTERTNHNLIHSRRRIVIRMQLFFIVCGRRSGRWITAALTAAFDLLPFVPLDSRWRLRIRVAFQCLWTCCILLHCYRSGWCRFRIVYCRRNFILLCDYLDKDLFY